MQRRDDSVGDCGRDGAIEEERFAEVKPNEVKEPARVLHDERVVQAEVIPRSFDLFGCRFRAEHDGSRIARSDM